MKKVEIEPNKIVDLEIPSPPKKAEELKRGAGRPKMYDPKFADLAGRLVAAGFTEKDLGYAFNCSKHTIGTWKDKYPEFKEACSNGKRREKNKLVAKALLSAVGYDYHTKKTRIIKDADGEVQKIEETSFDQHQPANERLLVFLLCNIDHQLGDDEWRSHKKLEIEQKNLNVQITGDIASEQIRKLAGKILNEPEQQKENQKERKQIECKQRD